MTCRHYVPVVNTHPTADIPIRLGGPWKRLVALNSLISIESSPHHYMPIGAYFITIVASHVPVHFNVTLGVVPVAGKGVLVPAEGDILTKRLHRLYPHPFAIFNTTVSMMGVYKLGKSWPQSLMAKRKLGRRGGIPAASHGALPLG